MGFDFLSDPTIWAGLLTLVAMEIVLGIDNLIFIAILADKLEPSQRAKARYVGLTLAMIMRLALLACISWVMTLTAPLFTVAGTEISGRDMILLVGGAFLIFKATHELHSRLEGIKTEEGGTPNYASFWQVVAQIIVLDAVFSLDSVITAVGMVDHIEIMMIAVVVAMGVMMLASKALMDFVSSRPTVVILCLGFLLMIGFSLIVEGLGYHIPKGYLYAAIGFSVLIEAFNQTAQIKRRMAVSKLAPRARTARAVLSILGGNKSGEVGFEVAALLGQDESKPVFAPQEKFMIERVLQLAEQPIQAIMTPRHELFWIDLSDDRETVFHEIQECPYSVLVVAKDGAIEEPLGILHKKDIADFVLSGRPATTLRDLVKQPMAIPESISVLQALDSFRQSLIHVAFVVDEYGTLQGLVTLTDVVEAIAGDLREEHDEEDEFTFTREADGSVVVNGMLPLITLREALAQNDLPEGDYHTAAGIVLNLLKRLPRTGDKVDITGWEIRVESMEKRRIKQLRFTPKSADIAADI